MNKTSRNVVLLLSITAAAAGGYVAYRYFTNKKKETDDSSNQNESMSLNEDLAKEILNGDGRSEVKEETEDTVEVPDKYIFGSDIAMMPEPTESERTEYATKAKKYATETDEEDDSEVENAYAESSSVNDYIRKNKNKIIVLPESDIEYTWAREDIGNDPDNPDVVYEEEELYYFTEDERLTDEDGKDLDEEIYLGLKPRQFGWFTNDKEDIYVRNNPLEKDFRVNKVRGCKEDFF